jgi:hypothetical protein
MSRSAQTADTPRYALVIHTDGDVTDMPVPDIVKLPLLRAPSSGNWGASDPSKPSPSVSAPTNTTPANPHQAVHPGRPHGLLGA